MSAIAIMCGRNNFSMVMVMLLTIFAFGMMMVAMLGIMMVVMMFAIVAAIVLMVMVFAIMPARCIFLYNATSAVRTHG
jgi:mannitol-specific phosphotransferase system IIBC component